MEAGSQPTAQAEFGSPTYSANFLVVRRGRLHQHCCLVATGCRFLRALPALLAHIVAPNRYLRIASLTSSCDSVLFRCESRSYKTAGAGVHVCHFCPQGGVVCHHGNRSWHGACRSDPRMMLSHRRCIERP